MSLPPAPPLGGLTKSKSGVSHDSFNLSNPLRASLAKKSVLSRLAFLAFSLAEKIDCSTYSIPISSFTCFANGKLNVPIPQNSSTTHISGCTLAISKAVCTITSA